MRVSLIFNTYFHEGKFTSILAATANISQTCKKRSENIFEKLKYDFNFKTFFGLNVFHKSKKTIANDPKYTLFFRNKYFIFFQYFFIWIISYHLETHMARYSKKIENEFFLNLKFLIILIQNP